MRGVACRTLPRFVIREAGKAPPHSYAWMMTRSAAVAGRVGAASEGKKREIQDANAWELPCGQSQQRERRRVRRRLGYASFFIEIRFHDIAGDGSGQGAVFAT